MGPPLEPVVRAKPGEAKVLGVGCRLSPGPSASLPVVLKLTGPGLTSESSALVVANYNQVWDLVGLLDHLEQWLSNFIFSQRSFVQIINCEPHEDRGPQLFLSLFYLSRPTTAPGTE